jgi:predicted DNA-binding transcriptional regulator AlpA
MTNNSILNDLQLINVRELSRILSRSARQICRDVAEGKFPKPVKQGRSSCWVLSEVTAYLEQLKRERDGISGGVA